jgi:NTE family protein
VPLDIPPGPPDEPPAAGGAEGAESYLPPPVEERGGVALCLSGGGFRAALFHLGALRRLAELGALGTVDTVSAVSGGSILAAHLAARLRPWPRPGEVVEGWEERVAAPFRAFTSRPLRTGPLLRRFLLPWNWFRGGAGVEALARACRRRLTALALADLPRRPAFVFGATDLGFGVGWVFQRDRVGDWQAGYTSPGPEWSVATAVAASSCFPPVFAPLTLRLDPSALRGGRFPAGDQRDRLVRRLRLSDGGLYDNLALEPVWKSHRAVLVSDGGAPFALDDRGAPVRLLGRYLAISGGQGASLRKRWLISSFRTGVLEGAYWGIGSAASRYAAGAPGYPPALVAAAIARVRTDLDAFLPGETAVLENHGYLLAEAAVRRHQPGLVAVDAPLAPPWPQWLDPERARRALRDSAGQLSLARLARRWARRGRP